MKKSKIIMGVSALLVASLIVTGCGKKIGEGTHNYFGPTKMSVNLIYLF